MIPVCVCGHGFDHHFTLVLLPEWNIPDPFRGSRCMECLCTDKRETAEQLTIGGDAA